jgi:SOS-response transcriptional repressor LexA
MKRITNAKQGAPRLGGKDIGHCNAPGSLSGNSILGRLAGRLEPSPVAERAMRSLAELLDNIQVVDQRPAGRRAGVGPSSSLTRVPVKNPVLNQQRLVPVLGRVAAASPRFWACWTEGRGLTDQMAPAIQSIRTGRWVGPRFGSAGTRRVRGAVAIVRLAEPFELAGLSIDEMLDSSWLVKRWPGAFALRIEGESMLPLLESGDLVVVSADVRARQGQPAVVQMVGQIGAVCKIYRKVADKVRLIPANPSCVTTVHGAAEVVWALHVLARVRALVSS